MKNFIDVQTFETYPDKVSIKIENIENLYPCSQNIRLKGKYYVSKSCIDLKKPLYGAYSTLHCLESYEDCKTSIEQSRDEFLTRKEARWYFYTFLILFPIINVIVKILVDLVWNIFK